MGCGAQQVAEYRLGGGPVVVVAQHGQHERPAGLGRGQRFVKHLAQGAKVGLGAAFGQVAGQQQHFRYRIDRLHVPQRVAQRLRRPGVTRQRPRVQTQVGIGDVGDQHGGAKSESAEPTA